MPKLAIKDCIFDPIPDTSDPKIREELVLHIQNTILTFLHKLNSATKPSGITKKSRRNSCLVNSFEIRSPIPGSSERFIFSPGKLSHITRQFRALAQMYSLILGNRRATKRDLYYEFKKVYKNQQRYLDCAVSKIVRFYHKPRHCFNVTSTSRGFAMGKLVLSSDAGLEVNFEAYPVAIGSELTKFTGITMKAEMILVVEKDTVFQRLIDDGIFTMIPNMLLVTGRGFPDICTRTFLRWLLDRKPVDLFCLVDCDPYGLQIYSTYRYGASRSEIEANGCRLNEMSLLGLLAWDALAMKLDPIHQLTLTEADSKRLTKVKEMAEKKQDIILGLQVDAMKEAGFKVELEALASIRPNYILKEYIIPKVERLKCIS